jgi:hypothetical protein
VPPRSRTGQPKKWHGVAVFQAISSIRTPVYAEGLRQRELGSAVDTNPPPYQPSSCPCVAGHSSDCPFPTCHSTRSNRPAPAPDVSCGLWKISARGSPFKIVRHLGANLRLYVKLQLLRLYVKLQLPPTSGRPIGDFAQRRQEDAKTAKKSSQWVTLTTILPVFFASPDFPFAPLREAPAICSRFGEPKRPGPCSLTVHL